MLALMAIGAFVWHLFQTGHDIGVVAVAYRMVASRVCTVYSQRMGEITDLGRTSAERSERPRTAI